MEYRRVGKSGLQVSVISIGAWATFGDTLDQDAVVEVMSTAYDRGVNFFDNAEVYADGMGEEIMGQALRRLNWPRGTYVVSTKVYWGSGTRVPNTWGLSRKHIFDACHTALRRLGTQYLDLYFCHRFDRDVPLEETVRAMGDLISQGKVLYWGTSEWSAPQIIEARSVAASLGIPLPITEQPKYNLLHRDRVEIEYARLFELGMGAMVWSPLASGLLSGRYDHGFPTDGRLSRKEYAWVLERALRGNVEKGMNDVRRVSEFAIELGVSPAQLALAWSIRHPQVSTAITGVSRVDQFTDSVECLRVLPLLTDEVLERIDAALGNKPSVPIEA